MLSDFRKSINSILYDRITSPFYGTLLTHGYYGIGELFT
jgi:hypothetical protein